MRAELSGVVCILVGATLALSTNDANAPKEVPAVRPEEAAVFATQLHHVAGEIADRYVRPVERGDLICTGLKALYKKAGVPEPPVLESGKLPEAEGELIPLIAKLRLELGNPEAIKGNDGLLFCLRAIVDGLDPYSAVLIGKELNRTYSHEEKLGFGLEVEPISTPGQLRIKTVLPGGPAQKAGLRPDDRITHIDTKPIDDAEVAATILDHPSPEPGHLERRSVNLTVER
ncbi:MAG: PDZ domain-containing protein, partial [Gemmataceae bacterium]